MRRHSIQASRVLVPAPSFFQRVRVTVYIIDPSGILVYKNHQIFLSCCNQYILMHVKDVLQHRHDPFSRSSTVICCTCCHYILILIFQSNPPGFRPAGSVFVLLAMELEPLITLLDANSVENTPRWMQTLSPWIYYGS